MEDNGVGDKELLVVRNYKRCWKICGRMWYVLLRLMPLGNSMDMGKGYDDMIGCATCSLSQCLMQ